MFSLFFMPELKFAYRLKITILFFVKTIDFFNYKHYIYSLIYNTLKTNNIFWVFLTLGLLLPYFKLFHPCSMLPQCRINAALMPYQCRINVASSTPFSVVYSLPDSGVVTEYFEFCSLKINFTEEIWNKIQTKTLKPIAQYFRYILQILDTFNLKN